MDNQDGPIEGLAELVIAAYAYIAKILGGLPIPIGLPHAIVEDDQAPGIDAIVNARELIKSEPLDQFAQTLADRLLLEWLTAYDLLGTTAAFGDEGWRHDAIKRGLNRVAVTGDLLEIRLNDPDNGE